MLYTKDFIATVKTHPASAMVRACNMAFDRLEAKSGWDEEAFDILTEAYALAASVLEAGLLELDGPEAPDLRGRLNEKCASLNQYLLKVRKECLALVQLERIELLKARTRHSLGVVPSVTDAFYQFDTVEVSRLRDLIREMKAVLDRCEGLDPKLRARMTRRLGEVEADLRETMSDWDHFWGMLGEARVLIAQCGVQAREFVLGLTEMSMIVGAAQSRVAGIEAPKGPMFQQLASAPAAPRALN